MSSPSFGITSKRAGLPESCNGLPMTGTRPHRRFHFPDHVAGDDLGMSQDLRDSPDFSVRQAAFFEPAQPFLVRLLQKNLLDLEAFDLVSGCLSNPLEDLENGFKACCVSLLGELGRDYRLQPHILPLIWRALVDYGSAWVRAKAIQAAGEMFSSSTASPPANLVDTIIVHLQDPKVVVHQAALRAVSRHPSWFDEKQSFEVLKCLYAHLHAYRDDKYQLDNICNGILIIGYRNGRLKLFALRMVMTRPIFCTSASERVISQSGVYAPERN